MKEKVEKLAIFDVVGIEAQVNGLKCLFSDKVTRESKLLQSTEFIGIEKVLESWKVAILGYVFSPRINNENSSVRLTNLDIGEASQILQTRYIHYCTKVL